MQSIPTAQTIKFNKTTDYKGDFVIEPLYPGYGVTVGNALRRVLISSIPGAAITSVKIKGVDHEFTSIDYVKEDVVDIFLNIKQVNLSIEGDIDPDEPLKITLNKKGKTKITAGDFKCPSQIKIANPKLHLLTLTDAAANFEMECYVKKGRGYLPVENRDKDEVEVDFIAIDSIFTPINHVNIENEHVRVGEMTNWDKLILSIETNKTITCQVAFDFAVNVLKEQFSALLQTDDNIKAVTKDNTEKSQPQDKDLEKDNDTLTIDESSKKEDK